MRAFTGEYRSVEVDGMYRLTPLSGGLVLHIPGRADVHFQPVFEDAFAGEMLGVIKFSRGTRGVVTGFTLTPTVCEGCRSFVWGDDQHQQRIHRLRHDLLPDARP